MFVGGACRGHGVCESEQPQGLRAEEMPLVICPGGKMLFHRCQTHTEVLLKTHLFIYCVHVCHGVPVGAGGQLAGWGLNLSLQACLQPLSEPSHWPPTVGFLFNLSASAENFLFKICLCRKQVGILKLLNQPSLKAFWGIL